jgi:hypothetical protein
MKIPSGRSAPEFLLLTVLAGCAASSGDRKSTSASAGGEGSGRVTAAEDGLRRHDFLYCGEWQTDRAGEHMYLVRGGKVVWSHEIGDKEEYGDCWMLSSGNIIFSRKDRGASEIKPDLARGKGGDIVWDYQPPPRTEVHTSQPIGADKVLVMQNGTPPRLLLINKASNAIEKSWTPEVKPGGSVHGQFRHVRMTDRGTLLLAHLNLGKVREYDQSWKVLWEIDAPSAWAAVRLKNGNTLVSGNQHKYLREVAPDKRVVWELTQKDVDFPLFTIQEATRLPNGNTIVNNWVAKHDLPPEKWPGTVQVFEVTPDKKVVWKLSAWAEPNLGPASATHILGLPGLPEKPGDQMR